MEIGKAAFKPFTVSRQGCDRGERGTLPGAVATGATFKVEYVIRRLTFRAAAEFPRSRMLGWVGFQAMSPTGRATGSSARRAAIGSL